MKIRELRVRYELKTANGYPVVNAVVCNFNTLKVWTDKVKESGYKLVGIDERFRDDNEWIPLNEGWKAIS